MDKRKLLAGVSSLGVSPMQELQLVEKILGIERGKDGILTMDPLPPVRRVRGIRGNKQRRK